MKLDEFCDYLIENIEAFRRNYHKLPNFKDKSMNFIQWFNRFKDWMEIGTYMHSEYYPYGTPADYEPKK